MGAKWKGQGMKKHWRSSLDVRVVIPVIRSLCFHKLFWRHAKLRAHDKVSTLRSLSSNGTLVGFDSRRGIACSIDTCAFKSLHVRWCISGTLIFRVRTTFDTTKKVLIKSRNSSFVSVNGLKLIESRLVLVPYCNLTSSLSWFPFFIKIWLIERLWAVNILYDRLR